MVIKSKKVAVEPQTKQWKVVVGGVYVYLIWSTLIRGYPLFYQPLILHFNSNLAKVSQISAYFYVSCAISGTLTPIIHKIFGFRWTVMSLSLIASTSVFVSSFLDDITSITILLGIIPGLCLGPALGTFLVLAAKFPEKHANVSFQIITLGISIGPLILCPGILLLIDFYSWQGALQIFSGIMLNLLVAGAPLLQDKIVILNTPTKEEQANDEDNSLSISSSESLEITKTDKNFVVDKLVRINKVVKLEIFCDLKFWMFALIYGGYCLFYYSAVSYIIVYAAEERNLNDLTAATLISGICAGDAASKVFCGIFFARLKRNRRLLVLALTHFVSAFLFLMLSFASSFPSLMAVCVGIGLIGGGFVGCHAMTIVTEFEKHLFVYVNSYTNVIGLTMSTIGQLAIAILIDSTGISTNALYVGSGCAIFTGVIELLFYKYIFYNEQKNYNSSSISLEIR